MISYHGKYAVNYILSLLPRSRLSHLVSGRKKWLGAVGGRRETWILMLMSVACQHARCPSWPHFSPLPVSSLHTYNTDPSAWLRLTCAQRQKVKGAQRGAGRTHSADSWPRRWETKALRERLCLPFIYSFIPNKFKHSLVLFATLLIWFAQKGQILACS